MHFHRTCSRYAKTIGWNKVLKIFPVVNVLNEVLCTLNWWIMAPLFYWIYFPTVSYVMYFNFSIIWFLYIMFTILHLFANFRAVKSVSMATFNQARLHIAANHYLESRHQRVLGVKDTNRKEPVLISKWHQMFLYISSVWKFTFINTCVSQNCAHQLQNMQHKCHLVCKIMSSQK